MILSIRQTLPLLLAVAATNKNRIGCDAWMPSPPSSSRNSLTTLQSTPSPNDLPWNGEVVANTNDGKISGCSVTPVGGPPTVEWEITIDGVEADLGKFSDAIYKKITADAKRERFQGFRPGTIPPHLLGTYRSFAMDECARETVLEAMQQNNIRPFDTTRAEFEMENFMIPPPKSKKSKKGKKNKNKKGKKQTKGEPVVAEDEEVPVVEEEIEKEPEWRVFDDMKGALDAGWQPGQSFSFVAKKVKGQKVKPDDEIEGSQPLGLNYMKY